MYNNKKIGIGIITCDREPFVKKLINSLSNCKNVVDELIIINDGAEKTEVIMPWGIWVNNNTNLGVGKSKNKALKYLIDKDCEYLFLLEDDIVILNDEVFFKYIEASNASNIQHFNFAFHGLDNYINNKPAIKLKIDYSPLTSISLFPNVYGAFSFYTKKCIDTIGYMDENYYNAMEHVDHTLEIIKAEMHPPFRWFADISNSNLYIKELDNNHSQSQIRKNQDWIANFHKAADYFAKKHAFDVRMPYQEIFNKTDIVNFLKKIK